VVVVLESGRRVVQGRAKSQVLGYRITLAGC